MKQQETCIFNTQNENINNHAHSIGYYYIGKLSFTSNPIYLIRPSLLNLSKVPFSFQRSNKPPPNKSFLSSLLSRTSTAQIRPTTLELNSSGSTQQLSSPTQSIPFSNTQESPKLQFQQPMLTNNNISQTSQHQQTQQQVQSFKQPNLLSTNINSSNQQQ